MRKWTKTRLKTNFSKNFRVKAEILTKNDYFGRYENPKKSELNKTNSQQINFYNKRSSMKLFFQIITTTKSH